MSAPLLEMSGVAKGFGGVPALRDADLTIREGEARGLIGQNGAGKSTLIKTLTGVHPRDAGRVTWRGRPLEVANPREAQEAGLATIYQELMLAPQLDVAENVALGHEPRTRWGSVDRRAMDARAREALGRFGIDLDLRRPLGGYPTAIQQLVAIARAVSLDARLVIMDEPTSSLDEREAGVLFGVVRALTEQGTAVLYVTHFLDELFRVCHAVTVMRDGRTVADVAIADATRLGLVALMLGRDAEALCAEGLTGLGGAGAARETGAPLLEAEGLASDGRLRRLDLSVRAGEVVGLAGLLGSGRTEAARALFGLDRARGRMRFGGREGPPASPAAAIAAGVGYLTEDRKAEGIVPELSVRENLTLALLPRLARLGVIDEARERRIVEGFVRALGIKAAHIDQPIAELSGGNQQKVLLGRWLALDPRLLILDEPTRGVDVGAKREIQAIIRDRVAQGCAVLLISSEFEELIEGADRIVVMQDGRSTRTLENPGVTEAMLIHAVAEPA